MDYLTIDQIEVIKKGKRLITFSDGSSITLEAFVFEKNASSIIIGREINKEMITNFVLLNLYEVGLKKSFEWLSRKAYTEKELNERLQNIRLNSKIIIKVIERLKELGYIDDQTVIAQWIEYVIKEKKMSRLQLVQCIKKRVSDKELIDQLLKKYYNTDIEKENARELMMKKYKKCKFESRDERVKVIRYLYQHGFSSGTIRLIFDESNDEFEE